MAWESLAPDDGRQVDKERVAFRRILVSKQLYLHGMEHSAGAGGINKMIGVHSLHNSIEIMLRSILLRYEISPEKLLNIDFETMLNEIDKHPLFKDKGIRLPYSTELRTLNRVRNLVQHQAVEPEGSTMDEWRVFTRRFLQRACQTYFDLDFDSLSAIDMIENLLLRDLLRRSVSELERGEYKYGVGPARFAFDWALTAVDSLGAYDDLHSSGWYMKSSLEVPKAFWEGFEYLLERLNRTERVASLLSTGVSLTDYERFLDCTPYDCSFTLDGRAHMLWEDREIGKESARWACDFVVNTIVHWQEVGLRPEVPEHFRTSAEGILTNGVSELEWTCK